MVSNIKSRSGKIGDLEDAPRVMVKLTIKKIPENH